MRIETGNDNKCILYYHRKVDTLKVVHSLPFNMITSTLTSVLGEDHSIRTPTQTTIARVAQSVNLYASLNKWTFYFIKLTGSMKHIRMILW